MDPLLGGILTGGASLLGSIFNANQSAANTQATIAGNEAMLGQQENYNTAATQQAQGFDRDMVSQQENYETQMSNSAYQRAQADMKAAGLNPIAVSGGGSSTPSISAPTSSPMGVTAPRVDFSNNTSAFAGLGSAVQSAVNTATQLKTADATVNNLVQENANLKTKQVLDEANTRVAGVEAGLKATQAGESEARTRIDQEGLKTAINQGIKAQNEAEFRSTAAGKLLDQAGMTGKNVSDIVSPVGNILNSAKSVKWIMDNRWP